MSALSLQRREAINSRSKHSLESNHEKGTKTSYTDGFVPLCTSKKAAMLSAKLISIIKQIRTFSEEEVRIKNFWWSIGDSNS